MIYNGQDGIADFLKTTGKKTFTTKEISDSIGISKESTRRCLSRLVRRREIKRTTIPGKKTFYEVVGI